MDRPRVSTVLSSYFYYKTGCQVLLVKSVASTLESAVSRSTLAKNARMGTLISLGEKQNSPGRKSGPRAEVYLDSGRRACDESDSALRAAHLSGVYAK